MPAETTTNPVAELEKLADETKAYTERVLTGLPDKETAQRITDEGYKPALQTKIAHYIVLVASQPELELERDPQTVADSLAQLVVF